MSADSLAPLESFLQTSIPSSVYPSPTAIFDCDGTMIQGDIGEAMFYFQIEHFLFRTSPAFLWHDHPKRRELQTLYESLAGLPPGRAVRDRRFPSFADHLLSWYFNQLAEGKTAKACADIVRLLAGFRVREVREIAAATLRLELSMPLSDRRIGSFTLPLGIRYIRESVDALARLRSLGVDIWVVSGSSRWSVEAVFEPLEIPPRKIIGIDLLEEGAILSPQIREPVPVLEGKIEALRKHTLQKPCLVFSDSAYDIPLFKYSTGLRILVNSRNSEDHNVFTNGVTRDSTWVVIDQPTLMAGV